MKKILAVAIALLPVLALAEGTITETRSQFGAVEKITLAWTSSTNSWASTTTDPVRGTIERVVHVPSTTAGSIPLTFTITAKDASGLDVLAGLAAGVATNAASQSLPLLRGYDSTGTNSAWRPITLNDPISVIVTNCGSVRSGTVILYVR